MAKSTTCPVCERERGFTLVELLVAMALGSMLVGIVAFIFMQATTIRQGISDEVQSAFAVRGGLELIEQDLRGIQYPWQAGMDFQIERVDAAGAALDVLRPTPSRSLVRGAARHRPSVRRGQG